MLFSRILRCIARNIELVRQPLVESEPECCFLHPSFDALR